ncbi:hypothetical protein KC336_g20455, partial [Hortaea werneckii]
FTTFTTVAAPTRYADGTTTTVYATATATYDASSTTTTVDSKPWWHNNKRSETGFVKKIRAPAAQETSA